jgi:serine/threonine protein kinase
LRFEIIEQLGQGLQGVVWRVKDHRDGVEKAAKGFTRESDYRHEVDVIKKIHHRADTGSLKYITEVVHQVMYRGRYFAIFPLAQTTLSELVKKAHIVTTYFVISFVKLYQLVKRSHKQALLIVIYTGTTSLLVE